MKYKKEVEWIKNVVEIPNTTYDLLIDAIVDKLISKYDKALDIACCNVADLQKQMIDLRGHFFTDGRKKTLRDNWVALKEKYLEEGVLLNENTI